MRLQIAHVTATFPPYHGGTGNVCYHNARELARRGHEVQVLTAALPGVPSTETRDGFAVRRLAPLARVGNAPLLPGLPLALRGFDVIHLHYPFFGGELAALSARLARTPLVITYHQDVLLNGPMAIAATLLLHTTGRLALRSAHAVLFTSRDYGLASHARPLLQGRSERINELPNGVDIERFVPAPAQPELRARHGLDDDDRVVLLVAGLDRAHAFKGVEVLLRAISALPPQIKAVIVGDGDLRPVYLARANRLGIRNRVVFTGRVSDDDLPDYYRMADVAVLPSVTMGEAFGLVLIEALACGIPVIASDLPGVRTVVNHPGDGLLVPPGDPGALAAAIRHILADEPRRRAMGARGRARVESLYAWERIGAQLEALYFDLLGLSQAQPAATAAQDHEARTA